MLCEVKGKSIELIEEHEVSDENFIEVKFEIPYFSESNKRYIPPEVMKKAFDAMMNGPVTSDDRVVGIVNGFNAETRVVTAVLSREAIDAIAKPVIREVFSISHRKKD